MSHTKGPWTTNRMLEIFSGSVLVCTAEFPKDVSLLCAAPELLEYVLGFLSSQYGPEENKMIWKRLAEIDPKLNPRSIMRNGR